MSEGEKLVGSVGRRGAQGRKPVGEARRLWPVCDAGKRRYGGVAGKVMTRAHYHESK